MERTFRRYESRPSARNAFAEAEAATYLAHQIRVLRTQRGWTQKDLARRLRSTQATVSRLEDADYGRISFKTMVALAQAFDVAPVLKFVSTIELMRERWVIHRETLEVPGFVEEAARVAFVDGPQRPYMICSTATAAQGDTRVLLLETGAGATEFPPTKPIRPMATASVSAG